MKRKPRVLVVYKKSAYQLYVRERHDPHMRRRLRQGDPDAMDMRQADAVHQDTLAGVVRSLKRLQVSYELVYRANLRTADPYDVVVSVGGDGTVLQASHLVDDQPILGVNSDPRRSEAVFCAATKQTFESLLRRALAGSLTIRLLHRLRVSINGRAVSPLVLNDVLLAHEDPATMSRYRLAIGSRVESQKSSGLWIATAAGSSGAILAAGGVPMSWTSKRFQYRPRELYRGRLSRHRLTGGTLPLGTALRVTWLMREGFAFFDGSHVRHPLRFGDRVVAELSARQPLRLLGIRSRTQDP